MPKKKSSPASKVTKSSSRRLKPSRYKSLRLSPKLRQAKPTLISAPKLFMRSLKLLMKHWRLFTGIILIYLVLTLLLVKGLKFGTDIGEIKTTMLSIFSGQTAQLSASFAVFGILLNSAAATSGGAAGAYQSILLVTTSLAIIWALRQILAKPKTKLKVRSAFYRGMYPLVPFLLVLLVIGLQLIPFLVAGWLYDVVISGGLASTTLETVLWLVLCGLLALFSFYMLTSSLFALYIVTLPDLTPMKALRSARDLVRFRRWLLMRKIIFLPFAMLVVAVVIMVPIIMLSPLVASWLFFIICIFVLPLSHSYMYNLYRELL